jgi:hypothetical protein
MSNKEQGSISAFVVCSLLGITALSGLVFDGGRVVDAYADMSDTAENAARIGCQQIAGIRSGNMYVDNTNASRRIASYLRAKDLEGEIEVQDGGVRVTVRKVISMRLLSLTGIRERTVTVTRSAHVVSG